MGADFHRSPNPKVGAVFTYYLKDDIKTLKEQRREKEKELQKDGKDVNHPSYETLQAEAEEPAPVVPVSQVLEEDTVVLEVQQERMEEKEVEAVENIFHDLDNAGGAVVTDTQFSLQHGDGTGLRFGDNAPVKSNMSF